MKVTEVLWGKWAGDFMEGKLRGSVCGKNRPLQPKTSPTEGTLFASSGNTFKPGEEFHIPGSTM